MHRAVLVRIRRLKQHTGHPYDMACVLFFMAFVVRSFRLEQTPLRLDENLWLPGWMSRIWLFTRHAGTEDVESAPGQGCRLAGAKDYPPFQVLLLEQCL